MTGSPSNTSCHWSSYPCARGVLGRDRYDAALTPRDEIVCTPEGPRRVRRDDVWDPAAQLRAASAHAADEYAGRSPLELLQNAHDAHAGSGTTGGSPLLSTLTRVHGVVYVANAGTPFTHRSMTGL